LIGTIKKYFVFCLFYSKYEEILTNLFSDILKDATIDIPFDASIEDKIAEA